MFFKEEIHREALDTPIPNVFFSQVLPIVEPLFLKIYLYGYYLCQGEQSETFDNRFLAETLNVSLDDVMQAWDFFESCNLIAKHRPEGADTWDYSVEFKNLKRFYNARGEVDISRERALVFKKNEEYEKMYDKIESILGMIVMSHQQRSINEYISTHNISKELVVEAFRYCVHNRGSRSVNHAMSILRIWYSEGVRTVEDLGDFLMQRGERYGIYKKVLSFLGEYRLPTKAEEKLIDKWIDEYRFGIDVIEEAFSKATAIKSPNMRYVDGILRNWNEQTGELNLRKKENAQKKDPTLFRIHILEELGIARDPLTKEDIKALRYLYEHFSLEEITKTIEYMKKLNYKKSIRELYRLMKYPTVDDIKHRKQETSEFEIGREEIREVLSRKKLTKQEERERELEEELKLLSKLRTDWSEG
ncbi:DnaD domain protein [Filifactor villosus]|uniref:DnaD domain protein n=1 Tax=Filifactor villosus TaxID=29374 RepID=A0ABV9QH02_9FIRM